ncbi:4a-hydroxytetrahydrobiopterin dehydratase [Desertimonas flava]|uniref:4a-hydroxytetrahydrobiopterin dehydratase n=1 Tax=Desertimonas flava TaxID=2064846 RepID=UPI000E34E6E2|nr:4a-hydroxytetrahydrobiopterin dehydratase [Desertimonas flava]
MTDPKQPLTFSDVEAAGLDDWRLVLGSLRTRFATGNFAAGLAFVERIAAAAEEANHHPDVTLTYPEVALVLRSHDVDAITSRDIDLARAISGFAAETGISATPEKVRALELCLDVDDPAPVAPFYATVLGADNGDDDIIDRTAQMPPLWFQAPGGDGAPLPAAHPSQRWHLDVWVPADRAETEVQAVIDAGGRLVSDAEAPRFWVLEDAAGNRSCICTDAR